VVPLLTTLRAFLSLLNTLVRTKRLRKRADPFWMVTAVIIPSPSKGCRYRSFPASNFAWPFLRQVIIWWQDTMDNHHITGKDPWLKWYSYSNNRISLQDGLMKIIIMRVKGWCCYHAHTVPVVRPFDVQWQGGANDLTDLFLACAEARLPCHAIECWLCLRYGGWFEDGRWQ
jgi:hypothetical protein